MDKLEDQMVNLGMEVNNLKREIVKALRLYEITIWLTKQLEKPSKWSKLNSNNGLQ